MGIRAGDVAKRYGIMTLGLFVMNVGIAMSTKTDLGTTPISSIPFVLSNSVGWSLGTFTFLFNLCLVLLQYVLLREKFGIAHLIQIPVTFVFSIFTDVCIWLEAGITPETYFMRWVFTLLSIVILGVGISITILSRASMMPGEGAALAIAIVLRREYSRIKVIWDISLIVVAAVMSVILFGGELIGVREGTIAAGILVGFVVRYSLRFFKKLFPQTEKSGVF